LARALHDALPISEREGAWIQVPIEVPLDPSERTGEGRVRVVWAVDAAIQARHQRVGELTGELGMVEVTGAGGEERTVARDEVQQAVHAGLGIDSGQELFVAVQS